MDINLKSSDEKNLRAAFYELLQNFSTFPAATNFFLVQIERIPNSQYWNNLTENNIKGLGIRPENDLIGLETNKAVYQKYFDGYMFLATGVNLTEEQTVVKNRGRMINGFLPVGPFQDERRYDDTDLDIGFQESNISIVDGIIRPWIQLYSVYGNLPVTGSAPAPVLSTNINVYFLSKQQISTRKNDLAEFAPSTQSPIIRKIYRYKDCIPFTIKSANVAEYSRDMTTGGATVTWRFSRYDVTTPYT